MKPVGPRIHDTTYDFFGDTFQSVGSGVTYAIESFVALYRRAMADEIQGKFSEGELSLIIDVFNATFLTAGVAGQHVIPQVSDGIALDGLDEKWSIDKNQLLQKLESLSLFARAALEVWANGFWYGGKIEKDLGKYISKLV